MSRTTISSRPRGPDLPTSSGSCWSSTASSTRALVTDLRGAADAGEQVVLGQRRVDQRAGQLVVLGRPRLAAAASSGTENQRPVGVDLGGVREQRGVATREVLGARHPRGDPVGDVLARRPSSPATPSYGDSSPCASIASCSASIARQREAHVVVELERLPGLARSGIAVRVAGRLEGRHRDLVGADVVGVRVAAVLVVGGHHVRPERADQRDQRRGGLLDRHEGEAALGQRRQRVALGQPGVDEAEPAPARRRGSRGPRAISARRISAMSATTSGRSMRRVEDAAALAAGAGDDQHVDALVDVAGHGRGALARLVVGVGVHRHQAQLVARSPVHCPLAGPTRCGARSLARVPVATRPVTRSRPPAPVPAGSVPQAAAQPRPAVLGCAD